MKLKKWLVIGFLILFIASEAGALGVRCQVLDPNVLKNHANSTALPAGATTGHVLQFVQGGVDDKSPTTSSTNSYLPGGSTELQQTRVGYNMDSPTLFNLGDGHFKTQFGDFGGTIGVRVWEGISIQSVIDAQGWYGNSDDTSVSSAGDVSTKFWDVPVTGPNTFKWYRATAPAKPTVGASGYSLSYSSGSYNVKFTLTVIAGTGDPVQVVGHKIRVRKQGATEWWGEHDGATWTIEDNPSDRYFYAGDWYEAQAESWSVFGNSDWGSVIPFQIPPAGGDAATIFTFDLKAIEDGKLVINSIASPKATTADAIKDAVNAKAGSNVVVAVSTWDPTTGTSKTAGYDTASGALLEGSSSFDIGAGIGIQVYTTQDVPGLVLQ